MSFLGKKGGKNMQKLYLDISGFYISNNNLSFHFLLSLRLLADYKSR
jgi:hypothetical protein